MDDCDQCYQLSLGFTTCAYSNNNNTKNTTAKANSSNRSTGWGEHKDKEQAEAAGVLDIEVCLLIEENKVDDSGSPTFVNEGGDGEALICTGNDWIHKCIESSVRVVYQW